MFDNSLGRAGGCRTTPLITAATRPPRGRGRRIAVIVLSAFAMVFLLACSGGDSSSNEAGPDVTPSSATDSDAAEDAPSPAATAPPSTEPPTTVVPTTVVPTTANNEPPPPVVTAGEPVELDPGDPATCEVRVGAGGAFSVVTDVARGFDIAFAQALVERVYGTTNICFIPLTGAERWPALDNGEIDLLVRSTVATTSRDEVADFTRAYLLDGFGVTVRGDGEVADDLAGLSVAVATFQSDLLSDNTSAEVVFYEDFPLANAAFVSGETDAVAGYWEQTRRQNTPWGDYRFLSLDLDIEPIAVAVPEGEVELRDRLNEGIDSLVDDGSLLVIYQNEFGTSPWWEFGTLGDILFADR